LLIQFTPFLFLKEINMSGAFRTANATVAAHGAASVTPSDSAEIPITRSLFIGTGGNINAVMADGQTVLFKGLFGGTVLPVQVIKVLSTNTTAADIVALY
jgi:hypothetical protein